MPIRIALEVIQLRTIRLCSSKVFARVRTTRVYLATAHRNHDTSDNTAANLAAWCQRCHLLHDQPEHIRRRRALGDLFAGRYPIDR